MSDARLRAIEQVLEDRKTADPRESYTAGLYARGQDAILKKLGEEATETILAAKSGDPQALIHETADLWFHSLVMLCAAGLSVEDVLVELARRFDTSGLQEKAARQAATGAS